MGVASHVSELNTASTFRVNGCNFVSSLVYIAFCFVNKRGEEDRVGIGAVSRNSGQATLCRRSCKNPGMDQNFPRQYKLSLERTSAQVSRRTAPADLEEAQTPPL
jgi:hypothetical protein